jgi:mannitol/fructose-specific phosphotransferase system IIA component (Ntr-type)
MRISDVLPVELVLPAIRDRTKDEVIDTLAARIAAYHPEVDARRLATALRERERQMSTALVDGVAVPHARVADLARVVAAFARSPAGVACDSHDGRPTHLFFVLAAPAEAPGTHLKLLATVSRLLSDERCRARIMTAVDATAVLAALCEEEQRLHPSVRAA